MNTENTTTKKLTKRECEKQEARESLFRFIQPGDTIYTILRHVSASGMSRDISLVVITKDGETFHPNYSAAKLTGNRLVTRNGHDAIRVSGCGMDMGFHLVYSLGWSLWPKGTEKPHGTRNGEPSSDGGYALTHKWL